MSRGDRDSFVQIGALYDHISSDQFLRLRKWAIGDKYLTISNPNRGGVTAGSESTPTDQYLALFQVGKPHLVLRILKNLLMGTYHRFVVSNQQNVLHGLSLRLVIYYPTFSGRVIAKWTYCENLAGKLTQPFLKGS
jgi:hypothetical protein